MSNRSKMKDVERGGAHLNYKGVRIKVVMVNYGPQARWRVFLDGNEVPPEEIRGWTAQKIIDTAKLTIDRIELLKVQVEEAEAKAKEALAEQSEAILAYRAAVGTSAESEAHQCMLTAGLARDAADKAAAKAARKLYDV